MTAVRRAAPFAALAALLAISTGLGAQASAKPGLPLEGFRNDAGVYVSTASGKGTTAQEAEAAARGAALHGLFSGLGKDGLFAEVFASSPPLGLDFELVDSAKDGLGYRALVVLKVDDESVRIVERGPYLAAALAILDKAEAASNEADSHREDGGAAETQGDLGTALGLYGMAADACRSALELVDPVSDPSIFSTKGKRTSPELKKGLAAILSDSLAGIERVKTAEAALAADATSQAASDIADKALATASEAQALLDESAPTLGDVSAYSSERLTPLRDKLALERRSLADAKAALERAAAALPKGKGAAGYAGDKVDFAGRRLETADASLSAAYRIVDREIRDPAQRRAARAQAFRWALLHEPRENAFLRGYLPFQVLPSKGAAAAPMDAQAGFEGAFPLGKAGVWLRSKLSLANSDLEPGLPGGDEIALTQSFDFGVYSKTLFFAGYTWDWLRDVDEASYPKLGAVEIGIGGIFIHGAADSRYRRADWLLSMNYDLPYALDDFNAANAFNIGLDAQIRLAKVAVFEASVSKRLEQSGEDATGGTYASVFRWGVGVGLRLPPPFTIGAEYAGAIVQDLDLASGQLGSAKGLDGGHFRVYLQYTL